MRTYADAPALRRLAVLAEAHLLGARDEATGALRSEGASFRVADARGDGELVAADVARALERAGAPVPDDLDVIFERIDIDGNGHVSLVEFIAATMEPKVYCRPRHCAAAFGVLDADGDGFITARDVEALLAPGPLRPLRAEAIVRSAGSDLRGRIDYERFCALMREGAAAGAVS